jgi:acetoin:2,6-dichlorophenolindophenol oxidoreductase subunit alpha
VTIDSPPSSSRCLEALLGTARDDEDSRRYRQMFFIRHFEQTLLRLFDEGVLNGTTHCCIGQEADCVGVSEHLLPIDHVFSNHRCHGHYLARTGDALGLLQEIMGHSSGICGGVGGSQHICRPGFKSNGVLGGTVPAAAGIAMAQKLRGTAAISVAFIGDGTLGEGIVYETLNLASLWKLPLLIVCEDNGWSQSTPRSLNMAGACAPRFEAFEVPVTELDTTDVRKIADAAKEVIAKTRRSGPQALLIHTYRLCHHSKNDDNRPPEEIQSRWKLDPLRVHGIRITQATRDTIESEITNAMTEIVSEARALLSTQRP